MRVKQEGGAGTKHIISQENPRLLGQTFNNCISVQKCLKYCKPFKHTIHENISVLVHVHSHTGNNVRKDSTPD